MQPIAFFVLKSGIKICALNSKIIYLQLWFFESIKNNELKTENYKSMYLLGYDIGSSSVKAALVEAGSGTVAASDFFPKTELPMTALRPGWAEQDPQAWWDALKQATRSVLAASGIDAAEIAAIGISYQMHGLVVIDRQQRVLRPSIIWCDSRAVSCGEEAFRRIGPERALACMLNSPGNFTASKLYWVQRNEPEIYERIAAFMLPGDYIAMRLSGEASTTASGLSEGILWDFRQHEPARPVLDVYGIDDALIPPLVPTFGLQGRVSPEAASELGLHAGTPVTYRAGDQPNNALSLGVLEPGEIASTAGTSGVVYGVSDRIDYDPLSRVNTFAHVNHTPERPRLGILLCINGAGSLNAWTKRNIGRNLLSYPEMNAKAAEIPAGSEGVSVLPFGNGAERMLQNREPGAVTAGVNFNTHDWRHLLRASQEGVAFAFMYGIEIMQGTGMEIRTIKAGRTNMFLSDVFAGTLAAVSGAEIRLYDTDGAVGAARGAGIGAGVYGTPQEAFAALKQCGTIAPSVVDASAVREAYLRWKELLKRTLSNEND